MKWLILKEKMLHYHEEALNILKEFNTNEAKKSLIDLLTFVINRNK